MVIYEDMGMSKIGIELTRAYSDQGYYIERDGHRYAEAIDPTELRREYIETDIPIGGDTEDETEAYAEAGKILMGVIE